MGAGRTTLHGGTGVQHTASCVQIMALRGKNNLPLLPHRLVPVDQCDIMAQHAAKWSNYSWILDPEKGLDWESRYDSVATG